MSNIRIDQGTDLAVEIEIVDSAGLPIDLVGGDAVFLVKQGLVEVRKVCTIEDNLVKTKFTADETSDMQGSYSYEVKVKDTDGDITRVIKGNITVSNSIIKDFEEV